MDSLYGLLKKHNIDISLNKYKEIHKMLQYTKNKEQHNIEYERLEILGDSLLNFFTIKFLFKTFNNANEGNISKLKSMLVSSIGFSILSKKIHLDRLFNIYNEHTLGDMFEVIFGFIYVQSKYNIKCLQKLETFYITLLQDNVNLILSNEECLDYKSYLQSFSQRYFKLLPVYELKEKLDTQNIFIIKCCLGVINTIGHGSTIKKAEQNAAKKILIYLNIDIKADFI